MIQEGDNASIISVKVLFNYIYYYINKVGGVADES